MKNIMIIFMIVAFCLTVSPSVAAENPITDFTVVKDFQTSLVAGTEKDAIFTFSSSCDMNISIVCIIQNQYLIECDEWIITFVLDETIIQPFETLPGVFVADEAIETGEHTLQIEYYALPAVKPDNYEFTISLSTLIESVSKEVVYRSGSNNGWRFFVNKTLNETTEIIIDEEEIPLKEIPEEIKKILEEIPDKFEDESEPKGINALSMIFVIASIVMAAFLTKRE